MFASNDAANSAFLGAVEPRSINKRIRFAPRSARFLVASSQCGHVTAMIVLFTDFGLAGPYSGQVLAVLQKMAPGVPVVSLFADAPAGKPKPAAYLLAAYAMWFDIGSVFLCVVDPGVGSARRALIAEADGRLYAGPDNGLFELLLRRAAAPRCWEITWRPEGLSASFHGRDLFAPVAARLACGEPPAAMGHEIRPPTRPDWPDDLPEIAYLDHYGNALTGLRGQYLPATAQLLAGRQMIPHARVFAAVPMGTAFWYVNSNGLIEIAVNGGRADRLLGLDIGSPVAIARDQGGGNTALAPRGGRV
jgi:S-adenosyl-L-methionine hydrolase (adenosine-forming)